MKISSLLIIFLGLVPSLAQADVDVWRQRVVEIMTPAAKEIGLTGIRIVKSSDYPNNFGSVEIKDQAIEVVIGCEVQLKHPNLSEDAFTYSFCHELGHIFAGSPFYKDASHLSAEGQADYWAAAVCLKKVFRTFPEVKLTHPDPFVKLNCDSQFSDLNEQAICYRIAQAGMDFMTAISFDIAKLGQIDNTGFYRKPEFTRKETYFSDGYPTLQCRVETIAAGAFCNTSENNWDKKVTNWSCSNLVAARPGCWFKNSN